MNRELRSRYRPRLEHLESRIALSAECVVPNDQAFAGLTTALQSMGESSQAVENSAVFMCFEPEEAAPAAIPDDVPPIEAGNGIDTALAHIPADSPALDHAPPLGGTLPEASHDSESLALAVASPFTETGFLPPAFIDDPELFPAQPPVFSPDGSFLPVGISDPEDFTERPPVLTDEGEFLPPGGDGREVGADFADAALLLALEQMGDESQADHSPIFSTPEPS